MTKSVRFALTALALGALSWGGAQGARAPHPGPAAAIRSIGAHRDAAVSLHLADGEFVAGTWGGTTVRLPVADLSVPPAALPRDK
jgi:hypothetical protein